VLSSVYTTEETAVEGCIEWEGSHNEQGYAWLHRSRVETPLRHIRRRLSEGERNVDLARAYGLDPSAISHIKHRRHWKHGT
jgi:hypothetical protein